MVEARDDGAVRWIGRNRPAATTLDVAAQALLFGRQDKDDRMTAFLDRGKK